MIGKLIDNFKLIEFKGKGTFGSVYCCEKDKSIYAMKIFSSEFVFTEFLKGDDNRVTREIEALKMIDSDYVVKYISHGTFIENSWKYFYVVMDYVDGEDLESILKNGNLSEIESISIFKSILYGIDAIHKQNLIHRDLKPANIYITDNKKVKILDFGISKLIDFTSITNTGDRWGTPLYMSPEQISDSKNIDYRSDYYALGIILFRLLTNSSPYGNVTSADELYHKIKVEPPIPIRTLIPTISNSIDNLIEDLLQKENHKRPNSIDDIFKYLNTQDKNYPKNVSKLFEPSFFVRLWNEKEVLKEFISDGYKIEHAIFPINHQDRQKNLLNLLKSNNIDFIIDPAAMRLAYDTYSEVKGLVSLPYAPKDLNRLEIDNLNTQSKQQDYIKLVVDEQLKHSTSYVVSPFHVSNNSNLVKIKMDTNENWFSLDVKLLKETYDYLNKINYSGKLVSGFCIKTDVLTAKTEREYFLNVLTSLNSNEYWIYVDCIDNNSNLSQLYNYANTLLQLQKATNKPVIAGRIGAFGLVLLAFGLYAFESGTSRFESFYEDLYKDKSEPFNMYIRYYFPELLNNVAIERKNPAKIIQILTSKIGQNIKCTCPYCQVERPENLINDALTRKHFLYRRNMEIDRLRTFTTIEERVNFIEQVIKDAIDNYKNLKPIFKDDDYKFLKVWLEVIKKLREEWI